MGAGGGGEAEGQRTPCGRQQDETCGAKLWTSGMRAGRTSRWESPHTPCRDFHFFLSFFLFLFLI